MASNVGGPPAAPLSKKTTFAGVSLNIGGRNTNPFEFLLDGDSSAAGEAATKAMPPGTAV